MNIIAFLVFISSAGFIYSIKLTIKEAGSNNEYYVERGSLLTITCESDSISQKESIQWFLPSSPTFPVLVTDSTQRVSYKVEIIGNKRRIVLTVRDVSNDFSGTYYCKSYQREGDSQTVLASAHVLVDLYKPVTIVECNTEQWVMLNSTGTLSCRIDSEPAARVTWEFKGTELTQGTKYKINNWGLEIYEVTPLDAGQYVFKATNTKYPSSLVKDIVVTTFEIPRIISGPTIIGPVLDGVVEYWYSDIQCLATGNPPPTVHWFRKKSGNAEVQLYDPQRYFVNTNPKVGTMRITYPRYPDENDVYTCQAMLATDAISNVQFPKNLVSRSINISVSVRPQFTQLEQMNKITDPGKTVFINCRVRTTDPVLLIWQKHQGQAYEMGTQTNDPRITVSLSKEPFDQLYQVLRLEIVNVQFSDSWNYTCIATSPGYNYSYNGTIQVRQRPIMSNDTLTVEFGWLFNATNLTCISYGLPNPTTWTWYRLRYSVLNDINSTFRVISYDFENYSQSWLQILPDFSTQYFIFDLYECQALNQMGEGRKQIRFNRAQVPGPPQVTFVSSTPSSFIYQLNESRRDGGMKLLHYELVYRALEGPTTMYGPVIYQPDETTIAMDGLVHDTNYQISFYSCNAVGRSIDTTVNSRTPSATVPYPIRVISKYESGYPYGYNLEWVVPLNGGYPLLGYRILLWPLTVAGNYNGNKSFLYLVQHPESLTVSNLVRIYEPVLSNPYESVFRLDDLDAETIYKVSIESKNTIGYSNKTTHYFYTPIGDTLGKPARIRGFQTQLQPFIPIYFMMALILFFV